MQTRAIVDPAAPKKMDVSNPNTVLSNVLGRDNYLMPPAPVVVKSDKLFYYKIVIIA